MRAVEFIEEAQLHKDDSSVCTNIGLRKPPNAARLRQQLMETVAVFKVHTEQSDDSSSGVIAWSGIAYRPKSSEATAEQLLLVAWPMVRFKSSYCSDFRIRLVSLFHSRQTYIERVRPTVLENSQDNQCHELRDQRHRSGASFIGERRFLATPSLPRRPLDVCGESASTA